jgi:hypothetical protein
VNTSCLVRLVPLPLGLVLCGCAATEGTAAAVNSRWLSPGTGQQNAISGSAIERFFPLVDGMVYTYQTVNEVGEEGLLVARVHRADGVRGELIFPGKGTKAFELTPEGVVLQEKGGNGGGFVLKLPLKSGTTWRGEHGGQSKIIEDALSVNTPAGHYLGCVQTLEERGGDRPMKYSTTFCPDVGVVQIDVASGRNFERAVLKSYGPPMRMREDKLEIHRPGDKTGPPEPDPAAPTGPQP